MKHLMLIESLSALIFVLMIIYIIFIKIKINALQIKDELSTAIFNMFESGEDIERTLANFLKIVASVVNASSYAFYLMDEKSSSYVIKAVRHMTSEDAIIEPAYTGLLPYKKEAFLMPVSLPFNRSTESTTVRREGNVSFAFIPIKDSKAIILVGPVKRLSKAVIGKLNFIGEKAEKILDVLLESEDLKRKYNACISKERTEKLISKVSDDFGRTINRILSISIKIINASAGFYIREEEGELVVLSSQGFDKYTEGLISKDHKTLTQIKEFVDSKPITMINKMDKRFFKMPSYFIAEDVEAFLLVDIKTEQFKWIGVFCFKDNTPQLKNYQNTTLEIMTKKIDDIVNSYNMIKELSTLYIDKLRMLAAMLDNLKPETVGYSELMYRYAFVICKGLKLSQKDTLDITLAAYLSNIGIVGLSEDIVYKSGKYTEEEYETVKKHAEVGAAIIEIALGNYNIASSVRYHHERIDGKGYPEGLIGEKIPIGARIIAVVQTFIAMILGNEYREPLQFEAAIKELKSVSGTQLDENAVSALVEWFARKQQENINRNGSLGRCFEMRCVPKDICIKCPAYEVRNKNCWEVKGILCEAHGSKCDTCFVKTEYLHRVGKNHE